MKITIPWYDFVEIALKAIREKQKLDLVKPVFMKHNGYEKDSEVYCIPDYVEMDIREEGEGGVVYQSPVRDRE